MNEVTTRRRRWLIMGAGGQLGREWSIRLDKQGADFRQFYRSDLDITDTRRVTGILDSIRPDIVVNCAAYTKVDQAEDDIGSAEKINVEAVGNLAQLCAGRDVQLIHYSTDYVFPGMMKHRKEYPHGYPESFPPDPVNAYGHTKWRGEEAIRQANGQHLILRVSWLCGQYGGNFVKTMLRLAEERDHVKVVNDQFGCPTFTHSVVTNSMALIEAGITGTVHISSRGETSWYEFARMIFEHQGVDITVEPIPTSEFPTRAVRPAWSLLDIRTLADVPGTCILPWQQELDTMLRETQR